MRGLCIAGFSLLTVIVILVLTSTTFRAPSVKGPSIEFTHTAFDAGSLREKKTVYHRFPFRNNGTEPLQVDPDVWRLHYRRF